MASAPMSEVTTKLDNLNIDKNSPTSTDLRSKLKGVVDPRYNGQITHFRGIQYATIPERFAKPEIFTSFPGSKKEYTKFGPRCPQIPFDIRDFMQISKSIPRDEDQDEDELGCGNLNVTCPTSTSVTQLPVLMWVYGGSMMTSFPNAQHRLGDAGPLVAQSVELGKPFILVTINYRLNIFHFGDGEGEVNLALQDQKAALKWIKANISKFGGSPDEITVGGESAGAIYTHALLATGIECQRAILQSGSLYTGPPQTDNSGFGLVGLLEGNLQLIEFDKGNQSGSFGPEASVRGADVKTLVQALKDLQITRMWMWNEPYFKNWDDDKRVFGSLKGLLIGDCKDEWVLYSAAFRNLSIKKIRQCFETKITGLEAGRRLAEIYGLDEVGDDHDAARESVLHFMGDARFSAWPQAIAKNVNARGGKAYQYHYDEPGPFLPPEKATAQHGVDLFGLFGGYDDDVNDETRRVGRMMRTKWIDFINGEEPWRTDEVFLFGPNGMTGEVNRNSNAAVQDLNPRRRQAQFAVIHEVGWEAVREVWQALLSAAASSQ